MDAARGAPSLIVVTPIIRGHVYVYAREDALRVRTFDNDSRVYIYIEKFRSDAGRCLSMKGNTILFPIVSNKSGIWIVRKNLSSIEINIKLWIDLI